MSLFQIIVAPGLAALAALEIARLVRGRGQTSLVLFRALLWLAAATAVIFPNILQRIAVGLGIGRGADLLLYVLALAFLMVIWWLYAAHQRLRRDLTEIIRMHALSNAQQKPLLADQTQPPHAASAEGAAE